MRAAGAEAAKETRLGRRGGRPSRAQAERLGERILDVATDAFLREGYGGASIEAIARRARISKRTLYSRFENKAALFGAVVHRVVERLRPPDTAGLFEGGVLDEVLRRLARYILAAALTPQALALHRVILAEAARFPELAAVVAEQGGSREAVQRIAALLERERGAGHVGIVDPVFAATQFLQMVVGAPQRRALGMGAPMSRDELDAWAEAAVSLFLRGCRG